MKIQHLILLCSLLLPSSARADWIVVQNLEGTTATMRQTNQITFKIKGTKRRLDTKTFTSIIEDTDTGDQIVLMHPQKRYLIQSASQMKEMAEIRRQTQGEPESNATNTPPALTATGKKQKINGYETEEFVWKADKAEGRYFVTRDIRHYADLLNAMENGFEQKRKLLPYPLPDKRKLPGFPVRSEEVITFQVSSHANMKNIPPQQTITNIVTLVSATEASLPDSEFVAPSDYADGATKPVSSPTDGAAGLRDVLKQMEKQGLSDSDRKKLEQVVKDAEAQSKTNGR